jgi:hypothetical protein
VEEIDRLEQETFLDLAAKAIFLEKKKAEIISAGIIEAINRIFVR